MSGSSREEARARLDNVMGGNSFVETAGIFLMGYLAFDWIFNGESIPEGIFVTLAVLMIGSLVFDKRGDASRAGLALVVIAVIAAVGLPLATRIAS